MLIFNRYKKSFNGIKDWIGTAFYNSTKDFTFLPGFSLRLSLGNLITFFKST